MLFLSLLAAACDGERPRAEVPRVVGDAPLVAKERLEAAGFQVEFSRPPEHCPQRWKPCRLPISQAEELIVVAQGGTVDRDPTVGKGVSCCPKDRQLR